MKLLAQGSEKGDAFEVWAAAVGTGCPGPGVSGGGARSNLDLHISAAGVRQLAGQPEDVGPRPVDG